MRLMLTILMTVFLSIACSRSDGPTGPEQSALAAVNAGALLIDVRSAEEFARGHLPNAINIPFGEIVSGVAALQTEKTRPMVLYCKSGTRAGIAEASLAEAGYEQLLNGGGYESLKSVWEAP